MKKTITITSCTIGCFVVGTLLIGPMVASGTGITAKENLENLVKTRSCKGCDLTHLNLNRMDLSGVDLEGADLSFSKLFLTNLAGANLQNSTMTGAQLGGADLGDADLRGADLRGTSLENAYLGGARLDGEFVTTKPYESIGVSEIEKEVYVDDQSKPKKNPEKQEVKVGERRDFEEPPPQLAVEKPVPVAENAQAEASGESLPGDETPPAMMVPQPPAAKKINPVKKAVIDEPEQNSAPAAAPAPKSIADVKDAASIGEDNPGSPVVVEKPEIVSSSAIQAENVDEPKLRAPQDSSPTKVSPIKMASVAGGPVKSSVPSRQEDKVIVASADNETVARTQPEEDEEVATTPAPEKKQVNDDQSGAGGQLAADPVQENTKSDNLARLLDKNRCYGCDLSGLDLSGKDFEGADLEGANLSQCNLNKADLENANLKGANLHGADIRNADLRDADLYKADLTDADLTGAKMEGAMFDSAALTGTVGVSNSVLSADK